MVLGGEGNDTIRTGVEGAFDNGDVRVISVDFGGDVGRRQRHRHRGRRAGRQLEQPHHAWCTGTAPRHVRGLLYNNGSLANGVRIT